MAKIRTENWHQVIEDIKATGMTQAEIAKAIDCSTGTLSEYKNGLVGEPRWSRGQALLDLRDERCRLAA